MKVLQKKIAKEFQERMVAWAKNIKVSDPLEEGCRLGPVVSEGQVPHVNFF
jgi:betaine-aldehyde dehydrogenase